MSLCQLTFGSNPRLSVTNRQPPFFVLIVPFDIVLSCSYANACDKRRLFRGCSFLNHQVSKLFNLVIIVSSVRSSGLQLLFPMVSLVRDEFPTSEQGCLHFLHR